jgi:D-aspartate ligase
MTVGSPSKRRSGAPVNPAVACVIGDLDLVRPLGLAGVRCALVTDPGSVSSRSRFIQAVVPFGAEEVSAGAERLVDRLLDFASGQPEPPVLFYQEDEHLLFVSRHREQLANGLRFVIADATLVEDLVDKARFHERAERLCLPVPATRRIRPLAGSTAPDLDLRFPIVIKPLRRSRSWTNYGYTGKVVQISSHRELREHWSVWTRFETELLAQEHISGPETRVESYHVYVGQDGNIVGEFTGRKIRTIPPSHGFSTALTVTDAADVASLGRSLVSKLGLRGVAKFDFKRDVDGKLYLLEVNPRFNLWHHLGAAAGVNLPKLVYDDLVGSPRPASPLCARAGARWCRLSDDWRAAKACGMPLPVWLSWALGCEAKSVIWTDPMPLIETARQALFRQSGAANQPPHNSRSNRRLST